MPEWVTAMYERWAKAPRKPVAEQIVELRRRREEFEANRPVENLALGQVSRRGFVADYLLSRDWGGKILKCRVDWDLAPHITYFADGYKATVRFVGDIGRPVYWPEGKHLSEFVPPEPGDYYCDKSGLHPVGEWADRGGHIRQAMCRMHLHFKTVVSRVTWTVKQCPHCLAVKQGMVWGVGPSDWADQVEMTQRWVESYNGRFPLPGNGWTSCSIDGSEL